MLSSGAFVRGSTTSSSTAASVQAGPVSLVVCREPEGAGFKQSLNCGFSIARNLIEGWAAASMASGGSAASVILSSPTPIGEIVATATAPGGLSVMEEAAAAAREEVAERKPAVEAAGTNGTAPASAPPAPTAPLIKRIAEIRTKPPFTKNPKHDQKEFERQLDDQEKGLNELTVAEFLENRDEYLKDKRAKEADRAQVEYRKRALKDKIEDLLEENEELSHEEAKAEAEAWMKTQAALHGPDQIAGGKADNITGMGNLGVNSSLGAQWKNRIVPIDKKIREIAKTLTEKERKTTYLNIVLDRI